MFYALIVVLVLAVAGVLGYVLLVDNDDSDDTDTSADTSEKADVDKYTLEEVATHDSEDDCWIVVGEKIYDATEYINEHPAGPESVVANCGTDDTEGYESVGAHNGAMEDLESLYIGELAE